MGGRPKKLVIAATISAWLLPRLVLANLRR